MLVNKNIIHFKSVPISRKSAVLRFWAPVWGA